MLKLRKTVLSLTLAAFTMGLVTTALAPAAYANPPRWAKSHGFHKRQGHAPHRYRKQMYRQSPRQSSQYVNRGSEIGGTILGALFGAAAGSQFGKGTGKTVAIIGAAITGAIIGGEIGRTLDETDRLKTQNALENTPTGKTVSWKNPDTGSDISITPTRTWRNDQNQPCREYSFWAYIDDYEEQVRGTACRMPDGKWAAVKV